MTGRQTIRPGGDGGRVGGGTPSGGEGAQRPVVVLIGPPGAGLAEVGVRLGELLGLPVRDTDADVEAAAGMPASDIFVDRGEAVFRALEATAVAAALSGHRGVLVLGSGAVMDPLTQAALAGHPVALLEVDIADAARRLGFNRERPAGLGSPRAQWLSMMAARRPVYARLATVAVRSDGRGPDEVARDVVDALRLQATGGQR
jgi:shikimate kinase